jgi:membrane fusion protein (multidrug efflux system)
MKNDRTNIKNIFIGILIILVCLIIFRMIASIIRNSKKPIALIYNVGSVKAELKKVPHNISVQSIVEGDPEVKVYPQVSGIFSRNAVSEGDIVKKDQDLVFIDRNIIGYKYALAPVKAPIAGEVTKLYYTDKGDAVNPNNAVAQVADDENIKVVFNVNQDNLLLLKKGQKARISFIDDDSIFVDGEVYSAPPFISSDTMSGTIVVKAPNKDKKMEIGMSVNVDVLIGEEDSILVPEQAVLLNESGAYVYLDVSGKAKAINVTMGYKQGEEIEISSPDLKPGDEIITDGSFKLSDGLSVDSNTSITATAATGKK